MGPERQDIRQMELLAEKYLQGKASPAEIRLLHEWYDNWQDDELRVTGGPEEELQQSILARILREIRHTDEVHSGDDRLETKTGNVIAARWFSSPFRRGAAAAVVVILAGAGWLLLNNGRRSNPAGQRVTAVTSRLAGDLRPGRKGAVLTLSDGRHIQLDSTANGLVASQGNVLAMKKDDGLVYRQEADAQPSFNTMTTPRGRQYNLVLEDGSRVWLNASSSITFPTVFKGGQRVVEVSGEAYFEVAADPARPFIVRSKEAEIEVLGTSFDLNAYGDEELVRTTLMEGRIRAASKGHSVLLKPGQQAGIGEGIRVADKVDLEEVMAWKNGRFSFSEESLENIMRQVARWYDAELIFKDRINDTYTVDMSMDVPLSDLLRFLELSGGVHFSVEGRRIIVRK